MSSVPELTHNKPPPLPKPAALLHLSSLAGIIPDGPSARRYSLKTHGEQTGLGEAGHYGACLKRATNHLLRQCVCSGPTRPHNAAQWCSHFHSDKRRWCFIKRMTLVSSAPVSGRIRGRGRTPWNLWPPKKSQYRWRSVKWSWFIWLKIIYKYE